MFWSHSHQFQLSRLVDLNIRFETKYAGRLSVSRGALSKGRSSSRALQPILKRSCAVQLGYGLFPAWSFAPTRLNVGDDPTRMPFAVSKWNFLPAVFDRMALLDFMSCVSGVLPQIGSGWLFSLACSVDQRVAMQNFRCCIPIRLWPLDLPRVEFDFHFSSAVGSYSLFLAVLVVA